MTTNLQRFPQTTEEFESFVMDHLDVFVRYAVSHLGNIEDAEDVVQDVILKVFSRRYELIGINKPLNYMFRMISNSCNDSGRRKGSRETFIRRSLDEQKQPFENPIETSMIREEDRRQIHAMLDLLPDEQARVIRFRFIADLSFADIAELTSSPLTTVKSRFSYGMNKLRAEFLSKKED